MTFDVRAWLAEIDGRSRDEFDLLEERGQPPSWSLRYDRAGEPYAEILVQRLPPGFNPDRREPRLQMTAKRDGHDENVTVEIADQQLIY